MAVNANDPRPQATIRTVSGTNGTEPRGAYVDQALTVRNPPTTTIADDPPKSGSTTLGNIRRFYAADKTEEIEQDATNPGVDPPPHSPNKWLIADDADGIPRAADPYRNNGLHGRTYLNNAGG